jgi:hypothetical protein
MKNLSWTCRSLLCAAAAMLMGVVATAGTTPARAQPANAAELCTPDVMRLCDAFIPDADRIVVCLKAKRRQLSPGCLAAMSPSKARSTKVRAKKQRSRRY